MHPQKFFRETLPNWKMSSLHLSNSTCDEVFKLGVCNLKPELIRPWRHHFDVLWVFCSDINKATGDDMLYNCFQRLSTCILFMVSKLRFTN